MCGGGSVQRGFYSIDERHGQKKRPLYTNDTTRPLKQVQLPIRLGLNTYPGRAAVFLGISGHNWALASIPEGHQLICAQKSWQRR